MTIQNKFEIGQIVWVRTDPDQQEHMVTGVIARYKSVTYEVSLGSRMNEYTEIELSNEPNVLKRLDCNSGSVN